jgi:hypothetical protein
MDRNGDGFLTVEEVLHATRGSLPPGGANRMIASYAAPGGENSFQRNSFSFPQDDGGSRSFMGKSPGGPGRGPGGKGRNGQDGGNRKKGGKGNKGGGGQGGGGRGGNRGGGQGGGFPGGDVGFNIDDEI